MSTSTFSAPPPHHNAKISFSLHHPRLSFPLCLQAFGPLLWTLSAVPLIFPYNTIISSSIRLDIICFVFPHNHDVKCWWVNINPSFQQIHFALIQKATDQKLNQRPLFRLCKRRHQERYTRLKWSLLSPIDTNTDRGDQHLSSVMERFSSLPYQRFSSIDSLHCTMTSTSILPALAVDDMNAKETR